MSVVVAENTEHHQLVCKGALQEILNVCSQVRHNGEIVPLDDTMLRKIKRVTDTLNRQGCAWLRWRRNTCQRVKEITSERMNPT